jgi:Flp pilus assembly pilin Flp
MREYWSSWRRRIATRVGSLSKDRAGSVAMEYALVGSLISVAIIGALSATGTGVADKWNSFANTIIGQLR